MAWDYDEACFLASIASPEALDAAVPVPGTAFYYLVGAVDECGESAIGEPSGGERFASPGCP